MSMKHRLQRIERTKRAEEVKILHETPPKIKEEPIKELPKKEKTVTIEGLIVEEEKEVIVVPTIPVLKRKPGRKGKYAVDPEEEENG